MKKGKVERKMRRHRYVKVTAEGVKELEEWKKRKEISKRSSSRMEAVLLSNRGYTIDELSEIFDVDRDTISNWISRWERYGIEGLLETPKQNRPPKLNEEEQGILLQILRGENVRSAKEVSLELKEKTGKELSVCTIRRWAKRFNLKWKRMKKGLAKKKDETEYARAKEDIAGFEQLQQKGEIDIYYFDATGFDLTPTVPYAWQPIGSTTVIPSSRSKRINVVGFLNPRTHELHPFMIQGSVNSSVVVACFDQLCQTLNKPTIVIIDNAPVHTSNEFSENIEKWQLKGLFVYFLPTYSPTLNLIEILWKRIKYHWLPIEAYQSFNSLYNNISNILVNYGSKYLIRFA